MKALKRAVGATAAALLLASGAAWAQTGGGTGTGATGSQGGQTTQPDADSTNTQGRLGPSDADSRLGAGPDGILGTEDDQPVTGVGGSGTEVGDVDAETDRTFEAEDDDFGTGGTGTDDLGGLDDLSDGDDQGTGATDLQGTGLGDDNDDLGATIQPGEGGSGAAGTFEGVPNVNEDTDPGTGGEGGVDSPGGVIGPGDEREDSDAFDTADGVGNDAESFDAQDGVGR